MKKNETKKAAGRASRTLETAEKAQEKLRAEIRLTKSYSAIKDAVFAAIDDAASKGRGGVCLAEARIPGELGAPDKRVTEALVECADTVQVAETLVADLEAEGYEALRLCGVPLAVTWNSAR